MPGIQSLSFHAQSNPNPEERGRLEAIHPSNPLCRSAYLDVKKALGLEPWILSLRREDEVVSACGAFLKAGRLNRQLEIPSLPLLSCPETFWLGVLNLCTDAGVTVLSLKSVASRCDPIPALARETYRRRHYEYALDLRPDPWKRYPKGLKYNITRARKAGLEVRRSADEADCQKHLRLAGHSLGRRRRRGEKHLRLPDLHEMIALLRGGVGELFQCVGHDGAALSSALILMAERGAMYALAGTSADGMACGASFFLVHELSVMLRAAGKEVFYLGDAAPDAPLQYFKAGFGAQPMQGESAEFLVGSRLRLELGRLARWLGKASTRCGVCSCLAHSYSVGSGSHACQTAEVMKRFERVVLEEKPDAVVVVGDVNSTIACALTAVKHGIAVAHVEAGLRSFDRTMPEEINRILTDAISRWLFVTEPSGIENLRREGISEDRIFLVGNVMIDTLLACRELSNRSTILDDLGLAGRPFGVLTLHRPANVDDGGVLAGLLAAIGWIQAELPLVFPVHPRTRKALEVRDLAAMPGLILTEPMGYLDFMKLLAEARLVLTDSGGIQEETTALGVPCLTLRNNTERPITIEQGTNLLVGLEPQRIVAAARAVLSRAPRAGRVPDLWDGRAAARIVDALLTSQ
jgi:UDP-N-acetylglucosamine 2-epimerase (non-hydrolysing)